MSGTNNEQANELIKSHVGGLVDYVVGEYEVDRTKAFETVIREAKVQREWAAEDRGVGEAEQ